MPAMGFYREQVATINNVFGLSTNEQALARGLNAGGSERAKEAVFKAVMAGVARLVVKKLAGEMTFQEGEYLDHDATNRAVALMSDEMAILQMESAFETGSLNVYLDYPVKTVMSTELRDRIRAIEDSL